MQLPARLFAGLHRASLEIADAVWPPLCPLCRAILPCSAHALHREAPEARCGRCFAALPEALPDGAICASCRLRPPGFERLIALGEYRPQTGDRPGADEHLGAGLRAWVLALKYGRRPGLARVPGWAMGELLLDEGWAQAGALLVPVPLHPRRRLERGHDQAAGLARAAAEASGLGFLAALARRRDTTPQGAPGSRSRRANVRAAFRVRSRASARVRGRMLLLVDDVATSGATLSECARSLRRAGAGSVRALVLARASPGYAVLPGKGVQQAPPRYPLRA